MIHPRKIEDFIAVCIHSRSLGLVHVKEGKIFHKELLYSEKSDLQKLLLLFDQVTYVVAFGLGSHRRNLRIMFEDIDSSLPDKKYVCAYNWAKQNIGTTTFLSVREYFGISLDQNELEFDRSGWHHRDYVFNAEMLAQAVMLMQESCGMNLVNAVSGKRTPGTYRRQSYFNYKNISVKPTKNETIVELPEIKYYNGVLDLQTLEGKNVSISGSFLFTSTQHMKTLIEELGGTFQPRFNEETHVLIVGDQPELHDILTLNERIYRGSEVMVINSSLLKKIFR
ncbi:BRCA1 C Terminus (BRCT) protein [Dyadobacter jejuensis]|uniref:BRCA1 C Terminus (BRCT) protein n=1 Tax=Dyadobacter jejuensis TaxID=1082580 RepID=A0A316ACU0_9BACT|nr:BRCT domain-containing protein [Dyadobacter jejuensis]PWJ55068.1 BRCA1 C Terminus (BRCT) protein [Dyadobacter jejuensis]